MKTKSTLLFGAYGSFEEVTVRKWKKLRTLSHKSAGSDKDATFSQLQVQQRVRSMNKLWHGAGDAIRIGLQEFGIKGIYPYYQKHMMSEGMYPNAAVLTLDGTPIARGRIPATSISAFNVDYPGNNYQIQWPGQLVTGQLLTDKVGLVFYDQNGINFYGVLPNATRDDGSVTVQLPEYMRAYDGMIVWLFFYGGPSTSNYGRSSNSVWDYYPH